VLAAPALLDSALSCRGNVVPLDAGSWADGGDDDGDGDAGDDDEWMLPVSASCGDKDEGDGESEARW